VGSTSFDVFHMEIDRVMGKALQVKETPSRLKWIEMRWGKVPRDWSKWCVSNDGVQLPAAHQFNGRNNPDTSNENMLLTRLLLSARISFRRLGPLFGHAWGGEHPRHLMTARQWYDRAPAEASAGLRRGPGAVRMRRHEHRAGPIPLCAFTRKYGFRRCSATVGYFKDRILRVSSYCT